MILYSNYDSLIHLIADNFAYTCFSKISLDVYKRQIIYTFPVSCPAFDLTSIPFLYLSIYSSLLPNYGVSSVRDRMRGSQSVINMVFS